MFYVNVNNLTEVISCPVDTRRKLKVHKMLRRRPGRLLKVLCTFNLRPVSTGGFFLLPSSTFNF